MEKKKQNSKKNSLSAKLKKNQIDQIKNEAAETIESPLKPQITKPTAESSNSELSTTSKYFSPMQTRHQRRIKNIHKTTEEISKKPNPVIKIEYEKDNNNEKNSIETITTNTPVIQNDKKSPGNKRILYTPDRMLDFEGLQKRYHNNNSENETVKSEKWQPKNWLEILQNIREMRSKSAAPVDTMGCDMCSDESSDEKSKRYHILVSLMLSSQTKDQTTYDAMSRLRNETLTPQNIVNMATEKLEKLLNPVSFYKVKAKNLQKTATILIEKYNSDIPNTLENLMRLPGVGPKMAHICMNSAWNIITGIGVDVHVHRISNRLGWVQNSTKEPEQTRKELEAWLPFENWNEINHLLVGFGQTICTPVNPKCHDCKNQLLCPSAFKVTTTTKRNKNVVS